MIARIAARTVARPARTAATHATAVRFYTENQFNRKEKAHEDQYVRKHEEEQLKKLKQQLAKNKQEAEALQQQINEHEANAPKN